MSQRRKNARDPGAQDEEERQYATFGQTLEDLDKEYPLRPENHGRTLLFSDLYKGLFNPLSENIKKPASGRGPARHRHGTHGPSKLSPQEYRRNVIERFISRWRAEVGDDFYPALRLILPSSDRERGVYGLKESNIAKLLVKLMKIDRHSEDAYNILHWKVPAQTAAVGAAGDFVGRCFDVLSKRPMRIDPGEMHIADVNELLDKLAAASGENEQLPIFQTFYQRMNAEELKWLLRIILKQMRIGATEKTILEVWHPNAQDLFSVSSSLRRVCWELSDPNIRLTDGQKGVTIMSCFQPQLCAYQMTKSFEKLVERLLSSNRKEGEDEFWIEEKLDGERMQLHMQEDDSVPGGKRFCYWSRKTKDYTYLYGESLQGNQGALTRHLKNAFAPGVRNIILDGEMIVWDPELDKILKFGTLKTAALSEQRNPYKDDGARPLFRVFDILYLNDQPLTQYTLRDRRNALEKAVLGVPKRLEVHKVTRTTSADEIEPMLRQIVSDASEGIVIKNPRSMYRLNERNDDWIKVKPEYMQGFGETIDVIIIGGYFGSGHRGGRLSSFLGGLRVTENDIKAGANPEKCYSFAKVGGGFRAEDYAEIRHHTEGKWKAWDPKNPPSRYIALAGGDKVQALRPDLWIRPSESLVMSVKAASVGDSDVFARGITLRFPRFKGLRLDRAWDSALDFQGMLDMRARAEQQNTEKTMKMEGRRRRTVKRAKRELVIAGQDATATAEYDTPAAAGDAGPKTKVFDGLEFCVLTDYAAPGVKKSKAQLEALIKEHGGRVSQRATAGPDSGMLLVADRKVVKVASLLKAAAAADGGGGGDVDIVRPRWILDCIAQGGDFLLPFEPAHLFHASEGTAREAEENVDLYGDSYARDLDLAELRRLLKDMPKREHLFGDEPFDRDAFLDQLAGHDHDVGGPKGQLFRGARVCFATADDVPEVRSLKLRNWIRYGGGRVIEDLDDPSVTQVVVLGGDDAGEREKAAEVRAVISARSPVPRVVTGLWVEDCWRNNTVVDEERYEPL
ncbi:ATP-dependent DNA ligase [Whalleya microplaca]|nr:ATP-dependent DNA ligase [Whalleya microplaca]